MAEPTNAEIEKAARVLVRSCEGSTSRVPGWLRALVDACDDRDQARAERNEAMVNGARHRENHGVCDEAVKKLTAERDEALARLRARELYGPRDND